MTRGAATGNLLRGGAGFRHDLELGVQSYSAVGATTPLPA